MSVSPTLPDGRYLHWDQLRHRQPPAGLTIEEWWTAMRFARGRKARPVDAMASAQVFQSDRFGSELP
jgi:hypothetical protein